MARVRVPRPDRASDLIVCKEHGVMLMGELRMMECPSCVLKVDAHPTKIPAGHVTDGEFRNRIEWRTMQELVPLMQAYLTDRKKGPAFVACWSWPRGGPLPAGYAETERFFNILGYGWGLLNKFIVSESEARSTIQNLRKAGFGAKEEGR